MNKLGIFINFWENTWDVDHIKYMKKAKDIGFDILEFQAQPLLEMTTDHMDEMKKAATEIEGLKDVPDVMSIVAFDRHAVMAQVAVICPIGEHWRVERDIRSRIKARFDREGIMMPHYVIPESESK